MTVVNTETGEILEPAGSSLARIDTTSELAVTSYLQQARDWLARAVDETGPEQIAAARAEIATAAEATKQFGLSKEIQLDAQEMVRRAEYALGKAIRKGQAEGTVSRREGNGLQPTSRVEHRPSDFATRGELHGNGPDKPGILAIADSVSDLSNGVGAQTFDRAIEDAKAEGNLSRANVARKIIGKSPAPPADDVKRTADAETFNALMAYVRKAVTPERTEGLKPRAREALIRTFQTAIEVLDQKEQS